MSLISLSGGDYDLTGWSFACTSSTSAWNSEIGSLDSQLGGCSGLSGWAGTVNSDYAMMNWGSSEGHTSYNLGWCDAGSNGGGGSWWNPWSCDQLSLASPTLTYTATEGGGVSNLYSAVLDNIHASNWFLQGSVSIEDVWTKNTAGFVDFDAKDQILSYSADGYTGSGPDVFYYTAQDAFGNTVTGAVDINVTPANPNLTTISGSAGGGDTLFATGDDQRVIATGGDDTVFALKDNDAVYAGGGNDTIFVNGVNDVVYAGSGHDTITFGGGNPATLILPQSTVGFDDVYGFNAAVDKLDLSSLLAGTDYNGCNWWNFVKVASVHNGSSTDTIISVNPTGSCWGSFNAVADLHGVCLNASQLKVLTSDITNALSASDGDGRWH